MKFNPATDTYVEKSRLRRIWKRLRGHPVYIITEGFSQSAPGADVKFEGNVMVFGHARHMPRHQQHRRWWRWPSKRVVYRGPAINDFGDNQQRDGTLPLPGESWTALSTGSGGDSGSPLYGIKVDYK